jgi:DNA-nicking Smr family endonuclease
MKGRVPKPPRFPPHRPLEALKAKVSPPAPAERPVRAATDDELGFERAVQALGVEALPPGRGRVRAPKRRAEARVLAEPGFVVREEDDWLEGYRGDLGPRVLVRVRGTPRATLDLHGLRAARARERLTGFLARVPYPDAAVVLVIVGKGRHSPGGRPVLAREIGAWLSSGSAARRVLAFRTAPPELGGSGGVLVLLKAIET